MLCGLPHSSLLMTPDAPVRPSRGLTWTLPILGAAGFAAAWVLLSLYTNRQHAWMAVLAAVDAVWMLRLAGWPRGSRRQVAAMIATAATLVLANWWIAAAQIGLELGLTPWDSAARMGIHHAWTIAQLENGVSGLVWALAALALAGIASR